MQHIHPPKLREFFLRGLAHIQQTKAPCAIKRGTPEFTAWAAYFDTVIGARPYWFKQCDADENRSFTVPAQWPEWFDPPQLEPPRERPRLEVVS
jgi:hypothetical protein